VKKTHPDFNNHDACQLLVDSGVECNESKVRRWHSNGHICLRLIHAASIHILAAIAVSTLRDVTNHLSEPTISEVEHALRRPQEYLTGPLAGLAITGIIQFVRQTQICHPTGVWLGGHLFGDLGEDDLYMDELMKIGKTNYAQLPREHTWHDPVPPFMTPQDASQDLAPNFTEIIETGFNPGLSQNKLLPEELRANPKANAQWTEVERGKAAKAICPATMDELRTVICERLKTGVKAPDSYVRVSSKLLTTSNLLIHGVGGPEEGLIAFVMSGNTLIPEILKYITLVVQVTTDIGDQVVDTAKIGPKYKFNGFHVLPPVCIVELTPRYQGKKAPRGMHPRLFLGESSQAGPYLDRAVRMLSGKFDLSYFLHCPLRQFNDAVELMLRPAIAKRSRFLGF
ncbi:hypothetical protein FRC10_011464, partial [Ceratobasidium sp. 414]